MRNRNFDETLFPLFNNFTPLNKDDRPTTTDLSIKENKQQPLNVRIEKQEGRGAIDRAQSPAISGGANDSQWFNRKYKGGAKEIIKTKKKKIKYIEPIDVDEEKEEYKSIDQESPKEEIKYSEYNEMDDLLPSEKFKYNLMNKRSR